jgi:hypothetical protein
VHWRSTARRGRLVIREFEQETPGSVTLLIDTRPEVQRGRDAESTLEDLIRAAASITWYVTSPSTDLNVSGGWHTLLRALAELQPEGERSPLAVLTAAPIRRPQTVIVLSPDRGIFAAVDGAGVAAAGVFADPESYAGVQAGDGRSRPDGPSAAAPPGRSPICVIRRGDDVGRRLEEGGR